MLMKCTILMLAVCGFLNTSLMYAQGNDMDNGRKGQAGEPRLLKSENAEASDLEKMRPTVAEHQKARTGAQPNAIEAQSSARPSNGDRLRIVVGRPNHYNYSLDEKSMWIAAVVEAYLHFRLNAINSAEAFLTNDLSPLIRNHRNFRVRVTKERYIEACKQLGASHLVYTEYEAGKKIVLHAQVIALDGEKPRRASVELAQEKFSTSLARAAETIAQLLPVELPGGHIFEKYTLSNDSKSVQLFGECIVGEGGSNAPSAAETAARCAATAGNYASMNLGVYAAARLFERAGLYAEAYEQMKRLAGRIGSTYPKLKLIEARYARKSGDAQHALALVEELEDVEALEHLARWERGRAYEALGEHNNARQQYQELIEKGDAAPRAYVRLAVISAGHNAFDESRRAADMAARRSGRPLAEILMTVGNELDSAGKSRQALELYSRSMTADSSNADILRKLGAVQQKMGHDSAAAATYVRVFELDEIENSDYVLKAAELHQKSGATREAAEAYSRYINAGHNNPEIRVRLAKLQLAAGNCESVQRLLDRLEEPWAADREVAAMVRQCRDMQQGGPRALALASDNAPDSERKQRLIRLSIGGGAALMAVGGFVGGLVMNAMLVDQYEDEYKKASTTASASRLHDELEQKQLYRTLCYAAAGLGAAGVVVNVVIPGR